MSQSRGAAKNSCKLRALDTKKNERLDGRRRRTSADARPTSSRIDAAAQKVMPGETSGALMKTTLTVIGSPFSVKAVSHTYNQLL
ncbi:hypothetical protein RM69_07065 [Mesotoga sp. SC_NapDC3]|nr:hypothetical protein RM69_07065 [Mesotoga sp. SC_NapDC3]